MDDEIKKIDGINPGREPYEVELDFDELIYKRRQRKIKPKTEKEKTFKEVLKDKEKKDLKEDEDKKGSHAKYKDGKRIY